MLTSTANNTNENAASVELSLEASTIALDNEMFVDSIGLYPIWTEYSWKIAFAKHNINEIAQIESDDVDLLKDFNIGDNISRMKVITINDLIFIEEFLSIRNAKKDVVVVISVGYIGSHCSMYIPTNIKITSTIHDI